MERTKIGVRVDEELWAEFRQFVQDNHNRTRGVLSNEVENAIREYMNQERTTDQLTRIEDDLATVKAMVAEGEGDGGATIPSESDVHTHTPSNTTSEKPSANAPRHEKVEYISDLLYSENETGVAPPDVRDEIEHEYGFGDRTVSKLVPLVVDELADRDGVVRHPKNDQIVGWGEQADEFRRHSENDSND